MARPGKTPVAAFSGVYETASADALASDGVSGDAMKVIVHSVDAAASSVDQEGAGKADPPLSASAKPAWATSKTDLEGGRIQSPPSLCGDSEVASVRGVLQSSPLHSPPSSPVHSPLPSRSASREAPHTPTSWCLGRWTDPEGSFFGGAVVHITYEGWQPHLASRVRRETKYKKVLVSDHSCTLIEVRADGSERHFDLRPGIADTLVVSAGGGLEWTLQRSVFRPVTPSTPDAKRTSAVSNSLHVPNNGRVSKMSGASGLLGRWSKRQAPMERVLTESDKWQSSRAFDNNEAMKSKVRSMMEKAPKSALYKDGGLAQQIVRNQRFELVTLAVILANAVWIAVDTDYNGAEVLLHAHWVFQVAEHCFCTFFVIEWILRFMALSTKCAGLKDGWFMFDTVLVTLMVIETWILTVTIALMDSGRHGSGLQNTSLLRLLRIMRLSRLSRMVRLLRAFPELLFMMKGLLAAARSVACTFALLVGVLYIFGIAFTQLSDGTIFGDKYFQTVLDSMYVLLMAGTLLDNVGTVMGHIGQESAFCAVLFMVVIFLAALTIMNMLVGVLCEVVTNVASAEKEALAVAFVKGKVRHILQDTGLDQNEDGRISKDELEALVENTEAAMALQEVGVDVVALVDFADFIFQSDRQGQQFEKKLDFEEFMDLILKLRGTNTATVRDMVDMRTFIHAQNTAMNNQLARIEERQRLFEKNLLDRISGLSRIEDCQRKLEAQQKKVSARLDSLSPPGGLGEAVT